MPSLFDTIPGYREAVERETTSRDLSFLDAEEDVAGVVVKPLTILHMILLDVSGNAFVKGRQADHRDIIRFLWIVSEDYRPDNEALKAFAKKLGDLDYMTAVRAIREYMDEALADSPPARGNKTLVNYWSWAASIVDLIASEYHWQERDILEIPLKRLFQYTRIIMRRSNPKGTMMFNPSDRVRSEWLREQAGVN